MKKIFQNKKIVIINMIIVLMMLFIPCRTYATMINPGDYKPNAIDSGDVTTVTKAANPIIGTIKTLGIVVAVVTLGVLGIKYMFAGINERAEYKKTMIPYLIGAVLVVAITQLLSVIIEIVTNVK